MYSLRGSSSCWLRGHNILCLLIPQVTFFLHSNQYQIATGIIITFLVALGLQGCAQAFSSVVIRGTLLVVVCGFPTVGASLVVEHGHHTQRAGELTFTTPAGPEQLTLQAVSPEQRGYRVFIDSL